MDTICQWIGNKCRDGAGLIVVSKKEHSYEHVLKFMFNASNNMTEYEALLVGMDICNALGAECLKTFSNFQLVVSQARGGYEVRDPTIVAYLAKVKEKSCMFKKFQIEHVTRKDNR